MKHLSESWLTLFDRQLPETQRQEALLVCIQWPLTLDALAQLRQVLDNPSETLSFRASIALGFGHFGKNFPWMIAPVLSELSRLQIVSMDVTLRRCAAQALAATQHVDALPCLLEALADTDNHVFADAAEAMGRFGSLAVKPLSNILQSATRRDDAKCVAAWQLGEIGHSSALPVLLTVLNSSTSSQDVRALCLWAIGQIGAYTTEVMEALKACRQESEPEIRLRAETALTKVVRNVN